MESNELAKMGARIKVEGERAYIYGPTKLVGPVDDERGSKSRIRI